MNAIDSFGRSAPAAPLSTVGDAGTSAIVATAVGLTLGVALVGIAVTAGAGALVGVGVAAVAAKGNEKPAYGRDALIGAGAAVGTAVIWGLVSR